MNELADRVAAYLADVETGTVPDIARAIRARDIDVRATLRTDPRFEQQPPPPQRSTRTRLWALVRHSSHSSPALNGNGRPAETPSSSASAEGLYEPLTPRSVGEAIRAANRSRIA